MESLVTQVSQSGAGAEGLQQPHYAEEGSDFGDEDYGSSLIHLNIQDTHYYITRDQLMSLPESLLLCLFPSGVFLDRNGQVITNLTPEDEVYIPNFFPDCFEYIMQVYTKAHEDCLYYPVNKIFDRSPPSRGLFSFASNHEPAEQEILHEKPTIIVLREDLDYYCVPQCEFVFDNKETSEDLLYHIMAQVKTAAGSYLTAKKSIFQGLYSSNRLKHQQTPSPQHGHPHEGNRRNSHDLFLEGARVLGPAEQHLKDMLCSSGFKNQSLWGNRFQEPGKTVISSLSLCRIANETTENFRKQYGEAKIRWEQEMQSKDQSISPTVSQSLSPANSNGGGLAPSLSNQSLRDRPPSRSGREKRKSRLSALADNVRSRSTSRQRSQSRQRNPETPKLYDIMPKPDINVKLLLFWRKPARKCWWGEEDLELDVEVYGSWAPESSTDRNGKRTISLKTPDSPNEGLHKLHVPVKLHIRRVWTLELSIVGVQ